MRIIDGVSVLERDEKVRAVLTRRGRPGNDIARFNEEELNHLAELYDAHVEPETRLAGGFDEFWAAHHARLEAAKATMAEDDPNVPRRLVRNRKAPVARGPLSLAGLAPEQQASTPSPMTPFDDPLTTND